MNRFYRRKDGVSTDIFRFLLFVLQHRQNWILPILIIVMSIESVFLQLLILRTQLRLVGDNIGCFRVNLSSNSLSAFLLNFLIFQFLNNFLILFTFFTSISFIYAILALLHFHYFSTFHFLQQHEINSLTLLQLQFNLLEFQIITLNMGL